MLISGANNLYNHYPEIDALNVFPVPDGDTGMNMNLTMASGAKEIQNRNDTDVYQIALAFSKGLLMGARGNSGVITSQIFRGFAQALEGNKQINAELLADAFDNGSKVAYKAVMRPVEGTILTVIRESSNSLKNFVRGDTDIIDAFKYFLSEAKASLKHTPELLPVLKEVGVVDSGGAGLVKILEGMLSALNGKFIAKKEISRSSTDNSAQQSMESDEFGYCTEFIIMLDKELSVEEVNQFKEYLLSIGDSLVCVADEELVKVHVHTNHPGLAFERALTYGALINMKIDNMKQEHNERISLADERNKAKLQDEEFKKIKVELAASKNDKESESNKAPEKVKKYGFVAVAVGDGMVDILKDMGMDHIISGGQTMNPSTDDILNAVADVNAENVFVFPNNKNIILAANQAASICKDKKVIIIPSTSIPQSISAMLAYNPEGEIDANENDMKEALSTVKTGEVTYAVRDTSIDGVEIHNGDIMGIDDGGIKAVGKDINETTLLLIGKMVDEESGLITVYTGNDISEEDSDKLCELLTEKYNDLEVEFHKGGQPIYYYLVSVE